MGWIGLNLLASEKRNMVVLYFRLWCLGCIYGVVFVGVKSYAAICLRGISNVLSCLRMSCVCQ